MPFQVKNQDPYRTIFSDFQGAILQIKTKHNAIQPMYSYGRKRSTSIQKSRKQCRSTGLSV